VEGARAGKPAHVGELRRRFGDRLYGAVYALSPTNASEIVDDVFLRLPDLLAKYDEIGKFEGWLARVARNRARSEGRAQRDRDARHVDIDQLPLAGRTAGLTLERAEIRDRLLASLDDRQRAVWLLFEAGHSHKEIAERARISVDNSQKIVERARRVLREAYARLLGPV
jgi:RNA polymerase sigma factor (sigma-70 family)